MAAGAPLAQDPGRRVYDVHEMRVRRVEIPGPVVTHVKYNGRVQTGDPAEFSRLDEVRSQSGDVSSDAVPAHFAKKNINTRSYSVEKSSSLKVGRGRGGNW